MTVQYYQDVLTAGPIGFLRLMVRWKGSIFKLIYSDFLLFAIFYILISTIHRYVLFDESKRQFESVVIYVSKSQALIPVAFIVGFYVNLIFSRFWQHFNTLPWISKSALLISTFIQDPEFNSEMNEDYINKEKEKTRLQKRTIIRYLVSSLLITLSRVSVPIKRRFKTIDDLLKKDIFLEHELELIKKTEPYIMQPFLPVMWATSIVIKASDEGRVPNESLLIGIIEEINKFRQLLQELFLLDQICVPLVYTQVVTLAIYSYFLSCLIGRQFIIEMKYTKLTTDFIVPIFTILQFIVYIGWIKLALTLVNPMGKDDEDFDLNSFIDYNFQTGISSAEKLKSSLPPLEKDYFFNSKVYKLPLNEKSQYKARPFRGSFCEMRIDNENWMQSIKSLLIDKDIPDDALLKSVGNISKQTTPRVRRQTPIFSPVNFISNFISSGKEENQSNDKNLESDAEPRKKSSEKHSLLAIVEEDTSSSHDIKITVTNH